MSALIDLLREEKSFVEQFLVLLTEEQAALTEGNADALAPINEKKSRLVVSLNELESLRTQITQLPGSQGGKEGMARWFSAHPDEKAASALWDELLSLATEARTLHELNGKLLSMQLENTGNALAALIQRPQGVMLYGSDGQTTSGGTARIFDSA